MKSRSRSAAPLRFAVVGLGHIAQAAVLPAFRHARPHVELAALVSGTQAKLKTLGKRYRVPHLSSYADADKLFDSGAVDAVYVATPNTEHAEWVIRAAEAGLHVLCEKPLAASVKDCERMIDACERNDVLLMTGYRLHFERCNLEVADIVRKKRIGEARYFDSQFSMQVKADNIRTDRELGGGPEWDIGIYCQNAARYVFQDEPTQVWATTTNSGDPRFKEIPETVHVILKFPRERIANFICSFGAADRSRYEIVGTKGSIVVDPAYEYAEGSGLRTDHRREQAQEEIRQERPVRAGTGVFRAMRARQAHARAFRQGRTHRRGHHRSHPPIDFQRPVGRAPGAHAQSTSHSAPGDAPARRAARTPAGAGGERS